MKLLLDQGIPRSAAGILTRSGLDAVHVGDLGLSAADDEIILERARSDARVVATLDADFHAIMALSGENSPSVIRVRIEGLKGPELAALLLGVTDDCRADLEAGSLVTVLPTRVRVRKLPLHT